MAEIQKIFEQKAFALPSDTISPEKFDSFLKAAAEVDGCTPS